MDKSFNDQELSDIMKEIEALEEDFSGEEEVHATSSVLEELAHMEEKEAIPVAAPAPVSLESKRAAPKPAPAPAPVQSSSPASTSMSFKVQGNLSLELQFDIGGKVVCLEVTESGLNIEMDGGMKFTVPVSAETTSRKKAA
ncbi:hypothetical protein [Peredibacter starrii]|uniref:Uncharacterized protein n=1 Tax=Peredibacter starrii TaxID=28202 RepID=A0AAX4HM41_9BACT|nr:hypothetical protein [Peredibacter starrii]WPU64402.1 hypothetical protein SOO65_17045 [Peredibacter starrii]